MSKKKQRKAVKKVETNKTEEFQQSPDIDPSIAINELSQEIINEAIKIEEGRIRTVFPLTKLAKQYKELVNSSTAAQ